MKQVEEQKELVRAAKEAYQIEKAAMQCRYLVLCESDRNLKLQVAETESKLKKLEEQEKTLVDLQAKLAKMKRGHK